MDTLSAEASSFRELSLLDPLTGLANRRALEPLLHDALVDMRDGGRPIALALLDIDQFKRVNDRHSHMVGDAVLRKLGELLRHSLRSSDFAARIGGDELVVLFGDASPEEARAACDRIQQAVASCDWSSLSAGLEVTLSIGVAAAQTDDSVETLMRRADRLMYGQKPEDPTTAVTGRN
jgi:diguanylate cyclase (GGDEF)-like protein